MSFLGFLIVIHSDSKSSCSIVSFIVLMNGNMSFLTIMARPPPPVVLFFVIQVKLGILGGWPSSLVSATVAMWIFSACSIVVRLFSLLTMPFMFVYSIFSLFIYIYFFGGGFPAWVFFWSWCLWR